METSAKLLRNLSHIQLKTVSDPIRSLRQKEERTGKMKRFNIFAGFLGLCLFLGGCQPTPETEAIIQKDDINAVVAAHSATEHTDTGSVSLRELLGAPQETSFEVTVEDGAMKITAQDVPVVVPETSRAGSVTVRRAEFSLDQVRKLTEIFFDGRTVYEQRPRTKQDVMAAVARVQEEISGTDDEVQIRELENHIQVYMSGIDELPDADTLDIKPMAYAWVDSESGEQIAGENKEGDISYFVGAANEELGSSLYLARYNETVYSNQKAVERSELVTYKANSQDMDGSLEQWEDAFSTNECAYSQTEAVDLCLEFLSSGGIDTEALLVSDVQPYIRVDNKSNKAFPGISGYNIYFSHGYEGMPQTRADNGIIYVSGDNTSGGTNEGAIPYQYESLKMTVDSSGITFVQWVSYMEVGDVLSENVTLKPYSEIAEIIRRQIAISYENYVYSDSYENGEPLRIHQIVLGLMRIQNKDDEDNYTLIPVWDVFADETGNMSMMTVNAMDGSMISRESGY